jgi:hypothetical protein
MNANGNLEDLLAAGARALLQIGFVRELGAISDEVFRLAGDADTDSATFGVVEKGPK